MDRLSLIMVVDDDSLTRHVMQEFLQELGYGVVCVANGQEALNYLGHAEPPALILLDLSMPVMGGVEFRRRQRQWPAMELVPVFLLSGEQDLAEIAMGLGVATYFRKPVSVALLLDAVRQSAPLPLQAP
jgi:CheY-like chemotaxis protein